MVRFSSKPVFEGYFMTTRFFPCWVYLDIFWKYLLSYGTILADASVPLVGHTMFSELDLRRLDPDVAANLLAQIRAGADIQPILSQLRATLARDPASLRY